MRRVLGLLLIVMLLMGCSSRTASDKWNDAEPDAMLNGNLPRAAALLASYTDTDLQNKVLAANEVQIGKAPWNYYGQAVKFFGQVTEAREFAPGSQQAKLIGGGGLLTVMNPTGTVAVVMVPGGTGQIMRGDQVTIYGFTAGQTVITTQGGMPGQGVLMVGNVLKQPLAEALPPQTTTKPGTVNATPPAVPPIQSKPPETPPKAEPIVVQDPFALVSRYGRGMTDLRVPGKLITDQAIVPFRFGGDSYELIHTFAYNLMLGGSIDTRTGPVRSVVLTTYAPFVAEEVDLFCAHAVVLLTSVRPDWKEADLDRVLSALLVTTKQLIMADNELPKGSNQDPYQREFQLTRKAILENGVEYSVFRGTNRYGSPIIRLGITAGGY